MDLTGKWRYIENYGYGVAEGELYLKQKGQTLAGRIVNWKDVKCDWKPSSSTSFIRSFR